MSEIVNLNRVRKAKARAERAREAAANRAGFGRTKAEKARDAEERARSARKVDQSRLEDS